MKKQSENAAKPALNSRGTALVLLGFLVAVTASVGEAGEESGAEGGRCGSETCSPEKNVAAPHGHDHEKAGRAEAAKHEDHGANPGKDTHDDHAGHGDHDAGHGDHGPDAHGGGSHDDHAGHDDHGEEGHTDEVKLSLESLSRYGVTVAPAEKRALTEPIPATARIVLNGEFVAHVGASGPGRVSEIKVRLGDAVKQGDALAVVESSEFLEAQSDFRTRRASAASAKPAAEVARKAYERAKSLYEKNQSISLGELQSREVELRNAESNLRGAESAARASSDRLRLYGLDEAGIEAIATSGATSLMYVLRSPIDGQVIEWNTSLGDRVGPDAGSLFVVADTTKLWVLADVPESKLAAVRPGGGALIRVPSAGEGSFTGTVKVVPPTINAVTRTAAVRIEVTDASSTIRAGMFAAAEIDGATASAREPMLAVPIEAIQNVEGGSSVFVPVPGEAGTFAKRSVRVGPSAGRWVPILSGLEPGEPVVVSGTFILKAELGKSAAGHSHDH